MIRLRASEDSTSSLPQALTRNGCAGDCFFFRDLDVAYQEVWVHRTRDNLEAFVNRGGRVKVAFFGGLDTLQRVEDPLWVAKNLRLTESSAATRVIFGVRRLNGDRKRGASALKRRRPLNVPKVSWTSLAEVSHHASLAASTTTTSRGKQSRSTI